MNENIVKRIFRRITYRIFPSPILVHNTYSQAGEDAVLNFLLADKKMARVSYLDIGTNTPDSGNNTYLLYLRGNRGVCVEADKSLIPHIQKVRPGDKIINAGVAPKEEGEADFYIFDPKGINTFDKDEAERRQAHGTFKIKEVVKVPLISINRLIKDNFSSYPDFLSIDIEGLDLQVLQTLDFEKYPISIICVETCVYSENHIRPKDRRIINFMLANGYEIYADTYINTIFVNKHWFYNVA